MTAPSETPTDRALSDSAQTRRRILSAFSEQASKVGIRGVVMIELARDLGLSSKTIYRHFPKKYDLVASMVEELVSELGAEQESRMASGGKATERMLAAVDTWLERTARQHPSFWHDLRKHYPDAWGIYEAATLRSLAFSSKLIRPELRADIDASLAYTLLIEGIQSASNTQRCERLGLTRREALRQVIITWSRGNLKNPSRLRILGNTPKRRS
jgi:AcrR family transcriptional regulator